MVGGRTDKLGVARLERLHPFQRRRKRILQRLDLCCSSLCLCLGVTCVLLYRCPQSPHLPLKRRLVF